MNWQKRAGRNAAMAAAGLVTVAACTGTGLPSDAQNTAQSSTLDTRCEMLAASTDIDAVIAAGEPADSLAIEMADCLGHPDPDVRDAFAYGSLAQLLRAGLVTDAGKAKLLTRLSAHVNAHERDDDERAGFLAPFSALVLSEVARTDRVDPWMSDAQRAALVETGASYVESVRDYRGFDDEEGWRHGVAHGADLLLQLSLNPSIGEDAADRIMMAVGNAISSDDAPAFIFDEPRRLSRPILYLTQRGLLSEEELTAWFEGLSSPAPLESWDEAFKSERALARRHNLRAFGYAVLVSATENEDENLKRLRPGALTLLSTIP